LNYDLPIVEAQVTTSEGYVEDIKVLLDMGSELTLADHSLFAFARNIMPRKVRFNGVGSGGKSNESGILTVDFNGVVMDLRVSFTTLPQGMDLILGLDSKLSRVDLDRNEATIDGNLVTIAGKNLGRIFPDQSIFQVSQEELGLVGNELELEDEQEDAKVQENPHKIIQDVLDNYANVFAVENWSTISSFTGKNPKIA